MQGDINVITAKQEDVKLIRKLSKIKHTVIVMSGKGGVGKSTVSVNLAISLSMRGYEVGILDGDIHGPNIPKMLKIEDEQLTADDNGIYPAIVPPHLKVMSMAFLSPNRDQPIVWRGPMKMGALRKFIEDVYWGDLDYLIVDLPPGTGDEPLTIAQLIPKADGAVIVTTPQEIALISVRRSIRFAGLVGLKIIGMVDNMNGFVCPHCGEAIEGLGGSLAFQAAMEYNVPYLGNVPLDPRVAKSADAGRPFVLEHDTAAEVFEHILDGILERIEGTSPEEGSAASPTSA